MQDPLEPRLVQLPLRRAPAHWKDFILNKTAGVRIRKKPSANLLALAASWALIGLLQWGAHEPRTRNSGEHGVPMYLPGLRFVRSAESYLEELLLEPESAPIVPRQSLITHKPAADRV